MEYKKSRWEIEYDNYNANKEELKSKMAAVRREQAELKEGPEYAAKKKELDEMKKTQVKYDKIEKNKAKIENILKFKKDLVEKTSELLEQKAEIEKHEKAVKASEQEIQKLDKERQNILNRIQQIDSELKNPNLKDEDKQRLQEERNKKVDAVKENDAEYSKVANKKDEMGRKLETFDKDKIEQELLKNEKLLGKCDLIGSNLLKGKSMEEISAKLENFEFKPNKDFAKKIQAMRDTYNKDNKEQDPENKENKNVEKEGEGKEPEGKELEGKEPKGKEPQEQEVGDNSEKEGEAKPVPISEFEQKHPRLAQIGKFFNNKLLTPAGKLLKNAYATVANKVSNIIKKDSGEKEEEKDTETIHDDNEKPVEEKTTEIEKAPEPVLDLNDNKDFEYAMKKLDGKDQDKILGEIAEKGTSGFRESVKVSKQEILNNMRKQSAKGYAEKYGGKYTTQDGADKEDKDEGSR